MKKTQKKILGLLGLTAVGVTTFIAATLPGPEASATSSITDTITVRVVSSAPNVDVVEPKDGEVTSDAIQTLKIDHENVKTITIKMVIVGKDKDGNDLPPVTKTFDITSDGSPNTSSLEFNLTDPGYGYGEYTITITGQDASGVKDEETIKFTFLPVITDATPDEETGDAILDLDYDEENNDIDHFEIEIVDENGNVVAPSSPIVVRPPENKVTIPFSEYDLPAGKYIIATTAYDADGNALYTTYEIFFIYKPTDEEPEPVPVPNTGGLMQRLNISKSDYLITGLIIFSMVGIAGAVYIVRSKKTTTKGRRK